MNTPRRQPPLPWHPNWPLDHTPSQPPTFRRRITFQAANLTAGTMLDSQEATLCRCIAGRCRGGIGQLWPKPGHGES